MKSNFLRIFYFLSILILLISCSSPSLQKENDPKLISGSLENGFSYYLYPNSYPKDTVIIKLLIKAGSLMENENQRGLAHFLEHMLFNGTESYPKNSLVEFLQSQGVEFGADINAYTSFDRTVYELTITQDFYDENGNLSKALDITKEWLRKALIEPEDINKERAIILQEKLQRGGEYNNALAQSFFSFLAPKTIIKDRLPIGIDSVIKNADREDFLSFYNEWYRLDDASLIIVGDNLDVKELEKNIKDIFESLVPIPDTEKEKSTQKVEFLKENLGTLKEPYETDSFKSFQEERVSVASLYIAQKANQEQKENFEKLSSYLDNLAEVINWMIERRLSELNQMATPNYYIGLNFNFSPINFGYLTKETLPFINLYSISLFEGREKEGIYFLFSELERLKKKGFIEEELSLFKSSFLAQNEKFYREKDRISSGFIAENIVSLGIEDIEYLTSVEFDYKFNKEFSDFLTLDIVNKALNIMLDSFSESYLYLYNPSRNTLLDRDLIEEWKREVSQEDLKDYTLDLPSELTDHIFEPVAILNESWDKDTNIYHWTLENGIQVSFKPTDFQKGRVSFLASSLGSQGTISPEEWKKVFMATDLVKVSGWGNLNIEQTEQFLADKDFSLDISSTLSSSRLSGYFTKESAPYFFESLYALIEMPKIEDVVLEKAKDSIRESILVSQKKESTPFVKSIDRALYGNSEYNFYYEDIPLGELSINQNLDFYKKEFGSMQDFHFSFVGDISADELKNLTSQYLGSLSTEDSLRVYQNYQPYIQDTYSDSISNDTENRATVALLFPQPFISLGFESISEFRVYLLALEKIYDKLLVENVREAISGTYSVSLNSSYFFKGNNVLENILTQVFFVTLPEKRELAKEAVLNTIKETQENGFSEENIDYAKKVLEKGLKESLRENSYWLSRLNLLNLSEMKEEELEIFISSIDSKKLVILSKSLIPLDNLREIVFLPKGD